MSKRPPIVYDPGWISAGTEYVAPILDVQSHLRGCGVIATRTVNAPRPKPRLRDASVTSDCTVTTADGSQYVIARSRKAGARKATAPEVRENKNATRHDLDYETRARVAGTVGNID